MQPLKRHELLLPSFMLQAPFPLQLYASLLFAVPGAEPEWIGLPSVNMHTCPFVGVTLQMHAGKTMYNLLQRGRQRRERRPGGGEGG